MLRQHSALGLELHTSLTGAVTEDEVAQQDRLRGGHGVEVRGSHLHIHTSQESHGRMRADMHSVWTAGDPQRAIAHSLPRGRRTSTATTSTTWFGRASTSSLAMRRPVTPAKHPLNTSSVLCVSGDRPSAEMRQHASPGSAHPVVVTPTTWVMSSLAPPQSRMASSAAACAKGPRWRR